MEYQLIFLMLTETKHFNAVPSHVKPTAYWWHVTHLRLQRGTFWHRSIIRLMSSNKIIWPQKCKSLEKIGYHFDDSDGGFFTKVFWSVDGKLKNTIFQRRMKCFDEKYEKMCPIYCATMLISTWFNNKNEPINVRFLCTLSSQEKRVWWSELNRRDHRDNNNHKRARYLYFTKLCIYENGMRRT